MLIFNNGHLISDSTRRGDRGLLRYTLQKCQSHFPGRLLKSTAQKNKYDSYSILPREVDKNCALLRYYTASSVNFLSMFRNNQSFPSSGFKDLKEFWILQP